MGFRPEQVAAQIQEDLAEIVRTRVSDPRIGYITITRVIVSEDFTFARVFVSEIPVEGRPIGQSIEALRHAAGFLRAELGKRLRLRHTPELRFQADHSIETGIEMTRLLDELSQERESSDRSSKAQPSDTSAGSSSQRTQRDDT